MNQETETDKRLRELLEANPEIRPHICGGSMETLTQNDKEEMIRCIEILLED